MVIRHLQSRLAKLHLELANYKVPLNNNVGNVHPSPCWVYFTCKIVLLFSFWSLLIHYTKSTFNLQWCPNRLISAKYQGQRAMSWNPPWGLGEQENMVIYSGLQIIFFTWKDICPTETPSWLDKTKLWSDVTNIVRLNHGRFSFFVAIKWLTIKYLSGLHVRPHLGFRRTWANCGQPVSDDRQLFAALFISMEQGIFLGLIGGNDGIYKWETGEKKWNFQDIKGTCYRPPTLPSNATRELFWILNWERSHLKGVPKFGK